VKITEIELKDYAPIKYLKLDKLGNVVIIAGANGAGKTRIKSAIVSTFQSGKPQLNMKIKATKREEVEKYFKGQELHVTVGTVNQVLKDYIQTRKYTSSQYVGSVVQIDSNRNIQSTGFAPVNWLGGDPDDLEGAGLYYANPFSNRWNEFMNYIHQKAAARDKKIADIVKANPDKTGAEIMHQIPDPMKKYKEMFSRILPEKKLQDINPQQPGEFKFTTADGKTLPFSALSSGEQEVVKVLFDVLRKDIRHSVIIVDEPELHLHPTLTFKLVESLKAIGDQTNQYILLTHSVDLISTYYSTGNVFFIDSNQSGANQAHRLSDLNHSHHDLVQLVGQNLGLFAIGKKIVFIEGQNSSIDRLIYHKVAEKYNPTLRFVSVGSVTNVMHLSNIEDQIRNSIFGIDFYMLRDRDALSNDQIQHLEANGRLKCLKRRHIENYFLDSEILSKVASKLYLKSSAGDVFKSEEIEVKLIEIAKTSIKNTLANNFKEYLSLNHQFKIPSVKKLDEKSIAQIKDEYKHIVLESLARLNSSLSEEKIISWLDCEAVRLEELVQNGNWRSEIQGKFVFSVFCASVFQEDHVRIREAYIDIALNENTSAIQDLIEILVSIT